MNYDSDPIFRHHVQFRAILFSESGFLIQEDDISKNSKGYVVLATTNYDKKLIKDQDSFSRDEILIKTVSKINFFEELSDTNDCFLSNNR